MRFVPSVDSLESRDLQSALSAHAINPGPGTGVVVGAITGAAAGGAALAPNSPQPLFPSYPAHQTETFPWAIKP